MRLRFAFPARLDRYAARIAVGRRARVDVEVSFRAVDGERVAIGRDVIGAKRTDQAGNESQDAMGHVGRLRRMDVVTQHGRHLADRTEEEH